MDFAKIKIVRPNNDNKEKILKFFEKMVKFAFEQNGIFENYGVEEEYEYKVKTLEEDIKSGGKERYYLFAFYEDEPIASISRGKSNDNMNKCSNGKTTDMIEIGGVFVDTEYQGNGLCTLMFDEMKAHLKNEGVKSYCLDCGYEVVGQKMWTKKLGEADYKVKDFWGEGSMHMVWIRDLI